MKFEKIITNPWFITIAGGFIFFFLGFIFYKGNIQTKGNYSPGIVKGNYVARDKISGNKVETRNVTINKNVTQTATGDNITQLATTGPIIIDNRKKNPPYVVTGKPLCFNKPQNKLFITKHEWSSQNYVPYVSFTVSARTIIDYKVTPLNAGITQYGSRSGKQDDGTWHESIFGFIGKYLMKITTTEPEEIKIEMK